MTTPEKVDTSELSDFLVSNKNLSSEIKALKYSIDLLCQLLSMQLVAEDDESTLSH